MNVYTIAKLLVPRVPLLLKTGAFHTLGLSSESSKWDLKTALIITTMRNIMAQSTSSITRAQRFSTKDPGVKGPMWIAPTTLTINENEDDLRQLLFQTIEELKETGLEVYERCDIQNVEAEWTAYRPNVENDALIPEDLGNVELYNKLMGDVKTDGTILYFHGGAHYLCDPSPHRLTVSQLCHQADGCRALSVRYRLAPKNPFPAGILDCIIAYLSLLYPHTSSLHEAVHPEKVVFAGDSAGGNICMSLLAFILHLRATIKLEENKTIRFNGKDVPLPLPLPGGIATNAAWTDFTRAMPSLTSNWHRDYLPYPTVSLVATSLPSSQINSNDTPEDAQPTGRFKVTAETNLPRRNHQPGETLNPFPCDLWPAVPPRADLYTMGESLCHPLVSPLILPAERWRGSCPLFFECGEEMLADEVRAMARRTESVGVKVRWVGFEAMAHCFSQILPGSAAANRGMKVWGQWIGDVFKATELPKGGTWVHSKTLREEDVDIPGLSGSLTDDEIFERMRYERERRCQVFQDLVNNHRSGSEAKL